MIDRDAAARAVATLSGTISFQLSPVVGYVTTKRRGNPDSVRPVRTLPALVAAAFLVSSLAACGSGSENSAGSPGIPSKTTSGEIVAYVKQSGDDTGWYRLEPPTSANGILVSDFGSDLYGPPSNDGSRLISSQPVESPYFTVRNWDGTAISSAIPGRSGGWNPSGTVIAYNDDDYSNPAVVDRDGAPAEDWAYSGAVDAVTKSPVDASDVEFEQWVTDDVMFVVSDGDAALARMVEGQLSLTPIDVENPNYPAFDRLGKGIFVDGDRLRQVDPASGAVTELATISPAPVDDYIANNLEWSPVSLQFSIDSGSEGSRATNVCTWTDTLACTEVPLPDGFSNEGAEFSYDGKTAAYDGYIEGSGNEDWHPHFVDLKSMNVTPVPYECNDTCYLYAYARKPG